MANPWIVILYVMSSTSISQAIAAPDNAGTEFILGFTEMTDDSSVAFLYITTVKTKNVSVLVTAPMFLTASISETAFNVTSGVTKIITISANIRMTGTQKGTKGILVSADDDVSVFGFDHYGESSDSFLALPTDVLGTDYFVITNESASAQSQAMLVGVADSTDVIITLGVAMAGNTVTYEGVDYSSGETFRMSLNRFDTFHFISQGDLSGTEIEADKNIAVFSGNKRTANDNIQQTSDHIIEQVPAVKLWGKTFVTSSIPKHVSGNFLKFVASTDKTTISKTCDANGLTSALRRAGDTDTQDISSSEYCIIKADKPILLTQFCIAGTVNTHTIMMINPPIEQYGADYTFTSPTTTEGSFDNTLMFIVNERRKNGLRIDGDLFPNATEYQPVYGTDYVVGHIRVSNGTHTVRHLSPIVTFGAYLYGTAFQPAYVTAAGTRCAPINTPCQRTNTVVGDGLDNDCDGRIDEELCVPPDPAIAAVTAIVDDDGDGESNEDCAKPAAVDGGWTGWSAYGVCSVTCTEDGIQKNGVQTRRRNCTDPVPANDGMLCIGSNIEYLWCSTANICPQSFSYILGFMATADATSHLVSTVNVGRGAANISVVSESGIIQTHQLNTSNTHVVPIGAEFTVKGSRLSSKAIRIRSDEQVLVYGFNRVAPISYMAGFVAREATSLGTVYYAITASVMGGQLLYPQLLIVATKSATNVDVLIRIKNGDDTAVVIDNVVYNDTSVFSTVMEEFDTLQIQSQSGDFTGMRIRSDKPVSVFSGNKAQSPLDSHLVEQLPPVSNWGKQLVSIAPRNVAYECKIVSIYPNTRVTYTCSSDVTTQNSIFLDEEGSHTNLQFDSETCTFVSDNPIMIGMFTNRVGGNSFLVILQPLALVNGNLVFYIPGSVEGAELVFATQTESYGDITVDCDHMTGDVLVSDGMTSGHKSVGSGVHIIRTNNSSVLLTGYIHGWIGTTTFSYPLVVNSSLVEEMDVLPQCGNGLGTMESHTAVLSTSNTFISTSYSLTETIQSTPALTESIQPTAALTESIQPTAALTESIQPTAALTESIQPTAALTESIQPTAALTESIQPTAAVTTPSTSALMNTLNATALWCPCNNCSSYSPTNYTSEELLAIIAQLRAELLVHKNATSSYIRTKTSAKDSRPSAVAVGCVGCTILVMVGVGILAMDAGIIMEMIKAIKRKLCPV